MTVVTRCNESYHASDFLTFRCLGEVALMTEDAHFVECMNVKDPKPSQELSPQYSNSESFSAQYTLVIERKQSGS